MRVSHLPVKSIIYNFGLVQGNDYPRSFKAPVEKSSGAFFFKGSGSNLFLPCRLREYGR